MKKLTFATLALIVLFAGQQVFANEHSENPKNKISNNSLTVTTTTSVTPTIKNHGEAVSDEAHEHEGGHEVSEIAKSSLGKRHDDGEENEVDDDDNIHIGPSVTPSVSPTATPSVTETPSVTLTDTPTVTPTETITTTPSETPSVTPTDTVTPTPTQTNQTLLDGIKGLLKQLHDMINSLTESLHI